MADKYISAGAAEEVLRQLIIASGKPQWIYHERTYLDGIAESRNAIREIHAADVRPVAEISNAVDEAIDFLSSVYSQMPYHVYSALFDLICGICPKCGADMRETGR